MWDPYKDMRPDGSVEPVPPLAITTEGLVRRFGTKVAVDGVDLAIREGEIYGFLGPNGAGKSRLVRVLCTLLRPSQGRARVAGYDVAEQPASGSGPHWRRSSGGRAG